MDLASNLNFFCDWLRSRVAAPVTLGRPDEAVRGIYIWPWRIVPNQTVRNAPPSSQSIGVQRFNVHFLLLATPACNPAGLANLTSAQQAIFENPVLDVAGGQLKVMLDAGMTTAELTALFIAAELQLAICFAYVLEGLSSQ
jgi:hypothetical protein